MSGKATALLIACVGFTTTVHPQHQTPSILKEAAHCLSAKAPGLLERERRKRSELSFGYFLDKESHPGEEALYLVHYPSSSRSKGVVYVMFVTEKGGIRTFDIQNNASFVLSGKEIDFVNPPLGGTCEAYWDRK
jgi:hypothetical protein